MSKARRLMKGRRLRYSFHWHKVIVLLLLSSTIYAQTEIKVESESGESLIGVFVLIDEQPFTTDINGMLSLNFQPKDSAILKFEYVGYQDLETRFSLIKENNFKVKLAIDPFLIEEIVVIGRTNARNIELPYKVKRIGSEDILKSNAQTTADALELNGGAYVQKSQMGGGSPILRGFEANKVLLVVDGVRMNNAIYRNGHLQNAITIDAAVLDQMEIIFGAGSLLYGSEALGGVVHFRTKSPLLNFNDLNTSKQSLSSYLRYNSANQEKKIHFDYSYGNKKWGVLTSLSFVDFDELRSGNKRRSEYPNFGERTQYVAIENNQDNIINTTDPNLQVGTAYSQFDLLQKWIFKTSKNTEFKFNVQYSSSSDIPRYDNLSEFRNGSLRFAEWYYGPQNRLLLSPSFSINTNYKWADQINIISSYQKIDEDRISRRLNDSRREHQEEDVQVFGVTVDFKKQITPAHKIVYGIDLHHNIVNSEAYTVDAYTENEARAFDILSRYPSDQSSLTNYGAFIQHNWQNQDSTLIWINGLRWTGQVVNIQYDRSDPFEWPEYFYDGIESRNSAFVGITGLNVKKGPWTAKLSSGTSFRSPNVDDLAKIRVNGDEITVPNVDLDAEKVWNNEINLSYTSKNFKLTASAYYTFLSDAIIRTNFQLPDGSTQYITQGDTLIVTANVNANSGSIRGLALAGRYNISKSLSFDGSINFQKGISKTEDQLESPLAHIPPTFGSFSLSYQKKKWDIQLVHRFNLWKNIEDFGGSVDNPEFATPEGSPSWQVLGIRANYQISKSWRCNVAIENLQDIHYRAFGSGLSAPGRHISLGLYYDWRN